jgi:hypothetical protein
VDEYTQVRLADDERGIDLGLERRHRTVSKNLLRARVTVEHIFEFQID